MIFLTVGTQLPFDRLVGAVDRWAERRTGTRVLAQIGASTLKPRHIESRQFMDAGAFSAALTQCRAVVGHAGIGTILGALELGKPVIVMPRRAAFGEHRNDHQLATVAGLAHLRNLHVAADEEALFRSLEDVASATGSSDLRHHASDELIGAIRAFIRGSEPTR